MIRALFADGQRIREIPGSFYGRRGSGICRIARRHWNGLGFGIGIAMADTSELLVLWRTRCRSCMCDDEVLSGYQLDD